VWIGDAAPARAQRACGPSRRRCDPVHQLAGQPRMARDVQPSMHRS